MSDSPLDTRNPRTLIGLALVLLGGLALLANFGLFGGFDGLIGGLLFAAAGAFFVRRGSRDWNSGWAYPVGFGLFGLAAAAIASGPLSGTYFLGLLGVGFVAVYLTRRERWWGIIPGGVLLTLGVVAGIEELFSAVDPGPVLFLGLAATFGYLYLLPEGGKRWAIYPALAAIVIAILSLSFTGGWLVPLVLIAIGAWLLSRNGGLPWLRERMAPTAAPQAQAPRAPAEPAAEPAPAALVEAAADVAAADVAAAADGTDPEATPVAEADAGPDDEEEVTPRG